MSGPMPYSSKLMLHVRQHGEHGRPRLRGGLGQPEDSWPRSVRPSPRLRMAENHAASWKMMPERVAPARAHAAHAVAQVDAIDAARALHRAVVHGEDHARRPARSGTTSARDCMRGRCSVSTNSPPVKSRPGSRQQDRHLQREDVLAVEVLVQAVVVARRRTAAAAASAASGRRRGSARGRPRARRDSATSMPIASFQRLAIGAERAVERRAQLGDQRRQRIAEIPVLAAPEAVARHHDAAAEARLLARTARRARWHSSAVSSCFSEAAPWRSSSLATRSQAKPGHAGGDVVDSRFRGEYVVCKHGFSVQRCARAARRIRTCNP